jgi:hypothetical protein
MGSALEKSKSHARIVILGVGRAIALDYKGFCSPGPGEQVQDMGVRQVQGEKIAA